MKFYLETLSEEFLPSAENILKEAIDILTDIIFNIRKEVCLYYRNKKKELETYLHD